MLQSAPRAWVLVLVSLGGACSNDAFVADGGSDSGNDILNVGGDGGQTDATADAGMDVIVTPRYCQTSTIAINAPFCADFDIPGDAAAGFNLSLIHI